MRKNNVYNFTVIACLLCLLSSCHNKAEQKQSEEEQLTKCYTKDITVDTEEYNSEKKSSQAASEHSVTTQTVGTQKVAAQSASEQEADAHTASTKKGATNGSDMQKGTPHATSAPTATKPEKSSVAQKEEVKQESVKASSVSKISKWYRLGFNRGYDDGEDDAAHHNGWRGSFDKSCKYKGQAKKEYELGYIEGYEAGFDDCMADDGSDEEYE